jgi:Cu/Ag efflux protein CusF
MRSDVLRFALAMLFSVFASTAMACDEYKQQQAAAEQGAFKPRIEVINYDIGANDNSIAQQFNDKLQGNTPAAAQTEKDAD